MAWFVGTTFIILGLVAAATALAWQWAGENQVDQYDAVRINDMFEEITAELRQP